MCLVIHSEGHLNVKLLHEQIWPRRTNGDLTFLECYDMIIRSTTDAEITKLLVLSPHRFHKGDDFFTRDQDMDEFAWIFEKKDSLRGKDQYGLLLLSAPNEEPLRFDVTRLHPTMTFPDWMGSKENDLAVGSLQGTGMTLAEVRFGKGESIQKFREDDRASTTYWLRLVLEPTIQHLTYRPIEFKIPEQRELFRWRPCQILCPRQVVSHLHRQLKYVHASSTTKSHKEASRDAARFALTEGLQKANPSTRIEVHRVSVLTQDDCLVLDTNVEGWCGFHGAGRTEPDQPSSLLHRTWHSGASDYPNTDPAALMAVIYEYLAYAATTFETAKSKEHISAAISSPSHPNVCHVVEAMCKLGLLLHKRDKFWIEQPKIEGEKLFIGRHARGEGGEEILGNRDNEAKGYLYGALPVPGQEGRESRFEYKGFRIHLDLAFTGKAMV